MDNKQLALEIAKRFWTVNKVRIAKWIAEKIEFYDRKDKPSFKEFCKEFPVKEDYATINKHFEIELEDYIGFTATSIVIIELQIKFDSLLDNIALALGVVE